MRTFVASALSCEACDGGSACAYRIAWSLNPHTVVGASSLPRARAQHAALLGVVRELGAEVIELPFVHGAYDSVFTKDNGLYLRSDDGLAVVMSGMCHPERRREQAARAVAFRSLGAQVLGPEVPFEGGDLIVTRDVALLGCGERSSPRAAEVLAATLGMQVLALELVDPLLYHLDTALVVLRDGTALFCEEAFSRASVERLRATFDLSIAVRREDAAAFALNVVEVGDTIVSGARSQSATALFRALGKRVVTVELDEFQRAGGSAACLLGPVYDKATNSARIAA